MFAVSSCKRDQNHSLDFLLPMRHGQERHNNDADLQAQCTFGTHGHKAWCASSVTNTAGLWWVQTPVTNRHSAAPPGLTQEQLPTSEKWMDKAVSTIIHRLIEPWEWLMKSNATAADKIRPSQVMKDRAPGWEGCDVIKVHENSFTFTYVQKTMENIRWCNKNVNFWESKPVRDRKNLSVQSLFKNHCGGKNKFSQMNSKEDEKKNYVIKESACGK